MKKLITTALALFCISIYAQSTNERNTQMVKLFEMPITKIIKYNYLIHLPTDYEETKQDYPMILFLHGAGERGTDINQVKKHGLPKNLSADLTNFPCIVISPQCPPGDWWSSFFNVKALNGLIDETVKNYRVDTNRIYITGLSMGGFGTWALLAEYPNKFAAAAPICGGGDPGIAKKIKDVPIWVFHGAKDNTVKMEESQKMVDALKKEGSDVKFTIYPEAGHNSWTKTYNNPELYEWLFEQSK